MNRVDDHKFQAENTTKTVFLQLYDENYIENELTTAIMNGRADDIIGTATGRASGNAVNWKYTMDVPVDNTSYRLTFDDWLWLMNDNVVMNRSYLRKFGITVAQITIFMQKP